MKDFFIELSDLIKIDDNRDCRCEGDHTCIIIILLVIPETDTEDDE